MRPKFMDDLEDRIITKEDEKLFLLFITDILIDIIILTIIRKIIKKHKNK